MNAALHQHAGAAHLEGLGDLLVDLLEVEDVAVVGARVGLAVEGQRTVEGAEGAVLGAVVGVVDVAIDDVGDHALGMQAAAHSVGLESQTDQVGGVKVIEGLLARDRHGSILQGNKTARIAGVTGTACSLARGYFEHGNRHLLVAWDELQPQGFEDGVQAVDVFSGNFESRVIGAVDAGFVITGFSSPVARRYARSSIVPFIRMKCAVPVASLHGVR